jgi:type IV pilus assembly protein PilN
MRISINLATRPFVELRPLFARMRLVMVALALLAVGLGFALHHMTKNARVDEAAMRELKVQTSVVENERANNEARMREPQNQAVLERSKFLNSLFEAKSFSWTAVMMDLENVLPAGVQVTSIDPVISAEGDVNIHLRVSGPRELQVDLVRNLERSQRFLAPHVSNETAQQEEQGRLVPVAGGAPGGVEFEIVSGYKPLPAGGLSRPGLKDLAEKHGTGAGGTALGQRPAGAHRAGPVIKASVPGNKAGAPGRVKKPAANGGAR